MSTIFALVPWTIKQERENPCGSFAEELFIMSVTIFHFDKHNNSTLLSTVFKKDISNFHPKHLYMYTTRMLNQWVVMIIYLIYNTFLTICSI